MDLSKILDSVNAGNGSNAADRSKFGQDYSQFLRLLTMQLKNQDPLSPMDTNEFTNQLVQFSSVEQQIKGNDYLQKLLTLSTVSLTGIALGYVGLDVFYPGADFSFNGTRAETLSYEMPAGAKNATLSIVDENGQTVYTKAAETKAGFHNLTWDGKDNSGQMMPAGTYKIRVAAQDEEGKALNPVTYTSATVTGIESGKDGSVYVMVGGKLVPVTDIRQASLPRGNQTGTNVAA